MKRVTVKPVRAGEYWELHIEGVGVTQSRNLGADADIMIRSYVAATMGVPANHVAYVYVL